MDINAVNEWAEDLNRDVTGEDLGRLFLLSLMDSEDDINNLQPIIEENDDARITKFMSSSGERYELRTTEVKNDGNNMALAILINLENASRATLRFHSDRILGASYLTEYDLKGGGRVYNEHSY